MEKKYFYEPAEDSDLLLRNVITYIEKFRKVNINTNFNIITTQKSGSEFNHSVNLKKQNIKKRENKLNETKEQCLNILEVGVGSGYIINKISNRFSKFNYFGTDINIYAIKETKKKFKKSKKKIFLKKCDLFPKNKNNDLFKKFDIIFFNPPYLPKDDDFMFGKDTKSKKKKVNNKNKNSNGSNKNLDDKNLIEKALYGGRKGIEVLKRFFMDVNFYLKDDGVIFVNVSSLSNYKELFLFLDIINFKYEIVDKEKYFFEELFCVKVVKNDFLKKISQIKRLDYLARGKHSVVIKGLLKNKKVAIKRGKYEYISKEIYFLKKLNEYSFVPKLYFFDKNFIVMEFVEGILIENFFLNNSKETIIKTINKILRITYVLDKNKINKFEFLNPKKHIFINKNKRGISIKLIDFERSIFSEKPKNSRQFLQYLKNPKIKDILYKKGLIIDEKKIFEMGKILSKKLKQITLYDILDIKK